LCEGTNHALIQAARHAIVNILDAGVAAEFGGVQASRQSLILAPVPLVIDQQVEKLLHTSCFHYRKRHPVNSRRSIIGLG
jgi:hypothetical protein